MIAGEFAIGDADILQITEAIKKEDKPMAIVEIRFNSLAQARDWMDWLENSPQPAPATVRFETEDSDRQEGATAAGRTSTELARRIAARLAGCFVVVSGLRQGEPARKWELAELIEEQLAAQDYESAHDAVIRCLGCLNGMKQDWPKIDFSYLEETLKEIVSKETKPCCSASAADDQ